MARKMVQMNPLSTANRMRRAIDRCGNKEANIGMDKPRNLKRFMKCARDEECEKFLGRFAQTGKIVDYRKLSKQKSS